MHVYTHAHMHVHMRAYTHAYTQTRLDTERCRSESHNPLQLENRTPFDLGAGHCFPLMLADSELSIECEGQRNG